MKKSMFQFIAVIIIATALLSLAAPALYAADPISFMSQAHMSTRNEIEGQLGYQFVPQKDIEIYALGRPAANMTVDHQVSLWDEATKTMIARVTVKTSSSNENGFFMEKLSAPVKLTAMSTYRIVSQEFAYGDPWFDPTDTYDPTADSITGHTDIAIIKSGVWIPDDFDSYPENPGIGGTDIGYTACNFTYVVVGEAPKFEDDGTVKSFLKKAESGERNDYEGSVGYEFTCLADLTVSAVGRPLNTKMDQEHTIYIWDTSDKSLVASAVIKPDSPLDELGFKKVDLAAPITLKKGISYRIVSSEFTDGDMWYDVGTTSDDYTLSPQNACIIETPAFTPSNEHDSYPGNTHNPGESNEGYVGVTFYYQVVGATQPAAETTPIEEAETADTTAPATNPAAQTFDTIQIFTLLASVAVFIFVIMIMNRRRVTR